MAGMDKQISLIQWPGRSRLVVWYALAARSQKGEMGNRISPLMLF